MFFRQQRYFEGTISQIQMHHASALGSLEQKAREKAAEKKKLVHDISHLERERTRLLQTMEHVRVETEEVEKCMKEIEEVNPILMHSYFFPFLFSANVDSVINTEEFSLLFFFFFSFGQIHVFMDPPAFARG